MSDFSSQVEDLSSKLDKLLSQVPAEKEPVTFKSIFRLSTFGFFEEYAQWKYEHPYISRFVTFLRFVFIIFMLSAFMWWLAGTAAGRVLSLDGVRDRFVFGYYSIVWASKGMPSINSLHTTPERFAGTVEKIVGDILVVSYYKDGKSVRRLARPANVIVTDKKAFEGWAKQYLLKGITIDFYIPIDKASGYDVWGVVMWSKRIPVNVQLVEQGIGYPEKNPETQVVNSVFSQYYYKRARSG